MDPTAVLAGRVKRRRLRAGLVWVATSLVAAIVLDLVLVATEWVVDPMVLAGIFLVPLLVGVAYALYAVIWISVLKAKERSAPGR